jgi:hypothetical protein
MYDGYDKNIQAPKYGWLPCQWKIMENPQFTDAFATKTSIYKGFSIVFSAKHDEPPWVQNGARIT